MSKQALPSLVHTALPWPGATCPACSPAPFSSMKFAHTAGHHSKTAVLNPLLQDTVRSRAAVKLCAHQPCPGAGPYGCCGGPGHALLPLLRTASRRQGKRHAPAIQAKCSCPPSHALHLVLGSGSTMQLPCHSTWLCCCWKHHTDAKPIVVSSHSLAQLMQHLKAFICAWSLQLPQCLRNLCHLSPLG